MRVYTCMCSCAITGSGVYGSAVSYNLVSVCVHVNMYYCLKSHINPIGVGATVDLLIVELFHLYAAIAHVTLINKFQSNVTEVQ